MSFMALQGFLQSCAVTQRFIPNSESSQHTHIPHLSKEEEGLGLVACLLEQKQVCHVPNAGQAPFHSLIHSFIKCFIKGIFSAKLRSSPTRSTRTPGGLARGAESFRFLGRVFPPFPSAEL